MRPFITGVVLAVILFAAGVAAPALLRSRAERDSARAQLEAEHARRQLLSLVSALPQLAAHIPVDRLRQAGDETLARAQTDVLAKLASEFAEAVSRARSLDQRSGLTETSLRPASFDPSGLKAAIGSFDAVVGQNRERLSQAAQTARQAAQLAPAALSVSDTLGQARLVEAYALLGECRRLRTRLTEDAGRVIELVYRAAQANADSAHYAAIDAEPAVAAMERDLAELEAQQQAAAQTASRLAAAVAERQQELAALRTELEQAKAGLLSLEETGFAVGNDAAFETYRQRYLELAERARSAQEREQLLTHGSRRGGTPVESALEFGHVQGGEVVVGLEQMERELAVAEVRAERLARAVESTREKIAAWRESELLAGQGRQRAEARREALRSEIEAALADLDKRAGELGQLEEAALRAAQEAAQAFRSAGQAFSRWVAAAREDQQNYDKMRKNERLRAILDDKYGDQSAAGGEAEARALVGWISAERLEALRVRRDTLELAARHLPGLSIELGPLDEAIAASRQAGLTALDESRALYEKLSGKSLPTNWVHLISLGIVEHVMARLDPPGAAQHRAAATDALRNAVTGRERSPYLAESVLALARLLESAEQPESQAP